MNNRLLNISLLLANFFACATSVEAQLWLQSTDPAHSWAQHHWAPTVDYHQLVSNQVKAERMALPENMKPFNDVMVMFKAAGYRTPEDVYKRLKERPLDVPMTLVDAVIRLPHIEATAIPKASMAQRIHPAMRFAEKIGLDGALLQRLHALRVAQDCGPEIAQLSHSYDKMMKSVNLLTSDASNLRATLGLLTSFYQIKARVSTIPTVPVLREFLNEQQGDHQAVDIFVRALSSVEAAAVKSAVETFYPAVHTYVHGPFRSPKYIDERYKALLHAIEMHKDADDRISKNRIDLLTLHKRMEEFAGKFNIVRGGFSLPPTVGFRAFMKQFDGLLSILRAGLERNGHQLNISVPADKPTATTGGAAAGPSTDGGVPGAAHPVAGGAPGGVMPGANSASAAPGSAGNAATGGAAPGAADPAHVAGGAAHGTAGAAAPGLPGADAHGAAGAVGLPSADHSGAAGGATPGTPGSTAGLPGAAPAGTPAAAAAQAAVKRDKAAKEAARAAKVQQLATIKAQLKALGDAIQALNTLYTQLKASVDAFEV